MKSKLSLFILFIIALNIVIYADISVVATGQGITFEQAKKDALRNAVEKAAGVKIFSQSEVKDFVALKDVIISESFGFVTSYEIIYKKNLGDIWEVKIKAQVTKSVKDKWMKIKVLLHQKGIPSVMFYIKEIVNGQEISNPEGEAALEDFFNKLGFKVMRKEDVERLKRMRENLYTNEQNYSNVAAIASQQGADILIIGTLEGKFVKKIELYGGLSYIVYFYTLRVKVVKTDTAEIIASVSENYSTKYNSYAFNIESAGRYGLSQVVKQKFIQKIIEKIIRKWITEVQSGTELTLVISNLKYRLRKRIIRKLREMSDVITWFRVEHYRNRRLQLRVKSRITVDELAEQLEELPGFPLEVVEVQKNYLELQYVK